MVQIPFWFLAKALLVIDLIYFEKRWIIIIAPRNTYSRIFLVYFLLNIIFNNNKKKLAIFILKKLPLNVYELTLFFLNHWQIEILILRKKNLLFSHPIHMHLKCRKPEVIFVGGHKTISHPVKSSDTSNFSSLWLEKLRQFREVRNFPVSHVVVALV